MNINIYQLLAMLLDSLNPILQMSKEVICLGSHGYQMTKPWDWNLTLEFELPAIIMFCSLF